ncbi:hypothetical protein CDAR_411081 [Caerostris darwini]|uniref:Uncharacterized protein n=1 Tax=Caerostris darwini TaxID=1538125 RepID=A0AAV4SHM1_9ARAC|nr:hypothetical protein CDAR_411081 [Caerostris darwini]
MGPVITSRKSRTRYRGTRLCHQRPRLSHRFVTFRPQDSFSHTRAPFLHRTQTKKEKKKLSFIYTFSCHKCGTQLERWRNCNKTNQKFPYLRQRAAQTVCRMEGEYIVFEKSGASPSLWV